MNSGFRIRQVSLLSHEGPLEFSQSLRETGFAIIKNHGISDTLIHDVLGQWKAFFDSQDKNNHRFSPETFLGYFPFGIENSKGHITKNAMEYFHHALDEPLPKGISNTTSQLFNKLIDIGLHLLSWLDQSINAQTRESLWNNSLNAIPSVESPSTVMRIIHYPENTHKKTSKEINTAHEDINLLTLLTTATAPGLQVKDSDNRWHDVHYDAQDIIVNAGDMLQMATHGYYKSATHRVLAHPNHTGSRYSIPLFLGAVPQAQLAPALTAHQYFLQRMEENGLKDIMDTH